MAGEGAVAAAHGAMTMARGADESTASRWGQAAAAKGAGRSNPGGRPQRRRGQAAATMGAGCHDYGGRPQQPWGQAVATLGTGRSNHAGRLPQPWGQAATTMGAGCHDYGGRLPHHAKAAVMCGSPARAGRDPCMHALARILRGRTAMCEPIAARWARRPAPIPSRREGRGGRHDA